MASILKAIEKVRKDGRAGIGEKGKFASWNKPNVKLFECKRDENEHGRRKLFTFRFPCLML